VPKKPAQKPSPAPPHSDLVPLDSLVPWARNPRKNASAVGKVAASIARFGFVRPLIVNTHPGCENEIIVGHTARLAALELGMTEVPVRFVRIPPEEAHAAALADNKLGEISAWDDDELKRLLTEGVIGAELFEVAGFAPGELEGAAPVLPPDDFADVPADAETHYTCPKCHYEWNGQPSPGKKE